MIINSKGRILLFNTAAEQLFGYLKKKVVNKNVTMLMPDDIAAQHDGFIKRYVETKKGSIIGRPHLFPLLSNSHPHNNNILSTQVWEELYKLSIQTVTCSLSISQ